MNNFKNKLYSNLRFLNLLTLLFIGLKLTNYISWSWWYILAPSWVPFIIAVIILTIMEVNNK